jgi:hypothetical protein
MLFGVAGLALAGLSSIKGRPRNFRALRVRRGPARGGSTLAARHGLKSRDEQGGPTMILRLWRGWTTAANADAYEELIRSTIFPDILDRGIDGLFRLDLYRRAGGELEKC